MRPIVPRLVQQGILGRVCAICEPKIERPIPQHLSKLCKIAKIDNELRACQRDANPLLKEYKAIEDKGETISEFAHMEMISLILSEIRHDIVELSKDKIALTGKKTDNYLRWKY